MKRTVLTGLAAGVIGVAASLASAGIDLVVGNKAPSLENVNWLKGEPVAKYEKGQVYVLDFWATWCGPCVASIPHINDMQKKYKDKGVNVIGVAIWPNERMTPTAEFVKQRGDGMSYRVAEDVQGKTAKAFMEAAGQNGIPTVMVVDQNGYLAWIGHPMAGLDEVVEQVVAGKYDLEEAAKKAKSAAVDKAKFMKLRDQANAFYQSEQWEELLGVFDEVMKLDIPEAADVPMQKYAIMVDKIGDTARAKAFGMDLVKTTFSDDPQMLNSLAWVIATRLPEDVRDLDLALLAAEKADKITEHADPSILDTLARVLFVKGDVERAIAVQETAVAKSTDERMRASLEEALTEYREAKSSM